MKKYILLMLMGTVVFSQNVMASEVEKAPLSAEALAQTLENTKPEIKKFKERAEQRRQEFEKRLQLTDDQKEKINQMHQESKKQMDEIKKEMNALKDKAHSLREKNKKDFESILTSEQKNTLETIKKEREGKKHRKKPMMKHK